MKAAIHRILLVLICLNAAAIFVLPFSTVFSTETNAVTGEWIKVWLLEDWIALIFYLPFIILWCLFLLKPGIISKPVFTSLIIAAALLTFSCSIFSGIAPAQDYEPGWGLISAAFLFPLFMVFIINMRTRDQQIKVEKTAENK